MSYELNFWRYSADTKADHESIYQQLCDGIAVDGVEPLPINDIVARLNQEFSAWQKLDNVTFDHCDRGGFQLFTTPYFFRIDCYEMDGDDMNKFIEIADEFSCPLYDPQVGRRFDQR
jgi:hypothetical protein